MSSDFGEFGVFRFCPSPCPAGATGATGAAGATGVAGASGGIGGYSDFFALMPGDNAATVAVGAAVQFPQNGETSGGITRTGASTFQLAAAGVYYISWQVSVTEPGQLQVANGGIGIANTVVGRATGTSQLVGSAIIRTPTANNIISIINPPGNSTALTITPIAGGTHSVSAHLVIFQLA